MFTPAEDDGDLGAATTSGSMPEAALLGSIRDGLDAPDSPRPNWRKDDLGSGSKSAVMPGKSMRLSDAETAELGELAGNLVDLQLECSIDIAADGWASVTYCDHIMNLTNRPVKRMTREQWFETTTGALKIEPPSKT